jgi:hypothetical protein
MRDLIFSSVYSLGLALVLPLVLLASKWKIDWLLFLSPVSVVLVAEALTFKLPTVKHRIQSRIGGLLLSWAAVGGVGELCLGEDRMQPIGMVLGLGAIYQLPIILAFSFWVRKQPASVSK